MTGRTIDSSDLAVAGHPFAPIGMGEIARSIVRGLRAASADPRLRDIYGSNERNDPDYEQEFASALAPRLSPTANIFAINGDEVDQSLAHLSDPHLDKAFNVIMPAWELSRYPTEWTKRIERFDEVWAMSNFVQQSIAASTSKPIVTMPVAVEPTLSELVGRRALGLPEHAFIFLFFFDFSSYMARKNPFAVLTAFNKLVERNPNAPFHLVLKHKGGSASAPDEARLREELSRHSDQVQVIDRQLSNSQTRNLVRNADCFVSLHRSEGFGFGLAEAMALGTSVVGTGYSGNMDFMTEKNSWLVGYDLVPVNAGEYPHASGQVWANARINHAVELMEAVWTNRAAARQKAHVARLDIQRDYSARAAGLRYLDRLERVLPEGANA